MKKKILLITGGTGGHVIPAQNFANYLQDKKIDCKVILDKRGYKYISNFNGKINIIYGSNLSGTLIKKIFGLLSLLVGFIQSFSLIFTYRPNIVISFGSYASFFPMLSCIVLKTFYDTKLYIHEQNSIIGRSNKFFLRYVDKVLLNFEILIDSKNKYNNKFFLVGLPKGKNVNFYGKNYIDSTKKFTIFIYGGSQGSEFITNFGSEIIKSIDREKKINAEFIFQCPKHIIKKVSHEMKMLNSEITIKSYFNEIDKILNRSSIVISRAGAGTVSDLITYRVPSILIPLPTAKDNHQFYNACILQKHDLAIILDQNKNEFDRAKKYIYEIYKNKNIMKSINNKFDKILVKNSNSLIYKLITDEK